MCFLILYPVDRYRVDDLLANPLHLHSRASPGSVAPAQSTPTCPRSTNIQSLIHLTSPRSRTIHFDRSEVSLFLSTYAHPAVSRRRTSRLKRQRGNESALPRRSEQAVDIVARSVVQAVGLGVGDVVAKLPVPARKSASAIAPTPASHSHHPHRPHPSAFPDTGSWRGLTIQVCATGRMFCPSIQSRPHPGICRGKRQLSAFTPAQ